MNFLDSPCLWIFMTTKVAKRSFARSSTRESFIAWRLTITFCLCSFGTMIKQYPKEVKCLLIERDFRCLCSTQRGSRLLKISGRRCWWLNCLPCFMCRRVEFLTKNINGIQTCFKQMLQKEPRTQFIGNKEQFSLSSTRLSSIFNSFLSSSC